MLWLLAARKKKLLQSLQLLLKHLLLPPTLLSPPQPLPTQPPLLQLLTLLLPLQPQPTLLQPQPTPLQPQTRLLALLTLLLRSNQIFLIQNRPAGRFFYVRMSDEASGNTSRPNRRRIKKPATRAGFSSSTEAPDLFQLIRQQLQDLRPGLAGIRFAVIGLHRHLAA